LNLFRPLYPFTMGRVRTKTIKKAAHVIIEKYYTKLTLDFHINKIIEEVALIPSKPLRNKVSILRSLPSSNDDKTSHAQIL
jgi:hypothetical protein